MDREIPKKERQRENMKSRLKVGGIVVACVAVVAAIVCLMGESLNEKDLLIRPAEQGTIESSVTASGKIVPLYEQAIVSPVATKIMEVYCNEGDIDVSYPHL
ncbi:MAG: efflux RND transporter periplasmic adaptor subunit, partial [Muribaculaceae bacterium]|nr:efflux RND transporter periplasmic adaptor subunit [Muribaculaceae bacterium]